MSSFDIERIQPGQIFEESTSEIIRDAFIRIVKIEQILAQKLTQWNAPTLIRGSIRNNIPGSGTLSIQDLYIQGALEAIPYTDWNGSFLLHTLTFPETYDLLPIGLISINSSTLDVVAQSAHISPGSTTQATMIVLTSGAPTTGTVTVNWITLGKKAKT